MLLFPQIDIIRVKQINFPTQILHLISNNILPIELYNLSMTFNKIILY